MKLAIPPQVLVRRGTDPDEQQRLVVNSLPTDPPTVGASADCSNRSKITIVARCTGGTSFTFDVFWYYANAGVFVKDNNVRAITVLAGETAAFVVSTGAASAVYVQVTANPGGTANGEVWAEANQ